MEEHSGVLRDISNKELLPAARRIVLSAFKAKRMNFESVEHAAEVSRAIKLSGRAANILIEASKIATTNGFSKSEASKPTKSAPLATSVTPVTDAVPIMQPDTETVESEPTPIAQVEPLEVEATEAAASELKIPFSGAPQVPITELEALPTSPAEPEVNQPLQLMHEKFIDLKLNAESSAAENAHWTIMSDTSIRVAGTEFDLGAPDIFVLNIMLKNRGEFLSSNMIAERGFIPPAIKHSPGSIITARIRTLDANLGHCGLDPFIRATDGVRLHYCINPELVVADARPGSQSDHPEPHSPINPE